MATITIYTIPGCPYCNSAKEWLNKRKISFKEISVPVNKDDRQILDQFAEYFPFDKRGVPIIEVINSSGEANYFNDEAGPEFQQLVLEGKWDEKI